MASRTVPKQSAHDAAVAAAKDIYQQHGKHAWINPGSTKNREWAGRYIDVIAVENVNDTNAWVTEVETDDSVSESEAKGQWKDYDSAYSNWSLAVPVDSEKVARALIQKHGISHATVITWRKDADGRHTFWGLPGI